MLMIISSSVFKRFVRYAHVRGARCHVHHHQHHHPHVFIFHSSTNTTTDMCFHATTTTIRTLSLSSGHYTTIHHIFTCLQSRSGDAWTMEARPHMLTRCTFNVRPSAAIAPANVDYNFDLQKPIAASQSRVSFINNIITCDEQRRRRRRHILSTCTRCPCGWLWLLMCRSKPTTQSIYVSIYRH